MAKPAGYRLERTGRQHWVVASDGECYGPYGTQRVAKDVRAELRNDARKAAGPSRSAAYRTVARDPLLKGLKDVLPRARGPRPSDKVSRDGDISRQTDAGYRRALAWVDKSMRMTSSDPLLHTKLQETAPGRRRTASAARSNRHRGTDTRRQVRARWAAMVGVAPRKRASLIAHEFCIDARHVRRLVK